MSVRNNRWRTWFGVMPDVSMTNVQSGLGGDRVAGIGQDDDGPGILRAPLIGPPVVVVAWESQNAAVKSMDWKTGIGPSAGRAICALRLNPVSE